MLTENWRQQNRASPCRDQDEKPVSPNTHGHAAFSCLPANIGGKKKKPFSNVDTKLWIWTAWHINITLTWLRSVAFATAMQTGLTPSKVATTSIITPSPHEVSRSSTPAWYEERCHFRDVYNINGQSASHSTNNDILNITLIMCLPLLVDMALISCFESAFLTSQLWKLIVWNFWAAR